MVDKKNKKYHYIIIILVLASMLVFAYRIGDILYEEDKLEKSDVIVVLMGSVPDRILEAVDLYNEGYSEKIIIVEEYSNKLLKEKNIKTPIGARVNKSIAIEKGVKEEDITIIKGNTLSTHDEAIGFRNYLVGKTDIDSILLVTSKYHSFRSKKIFEKALESIETNVKVISRPTKYDEFNAEQWWKNREDIEKVVSETLKLLNFYMIDQFKMKL